MRTLITAVFVVAAFSVSAAEHDGPFGLVWAETVEQVRTRIGAVFQEDSDFGGRVTSLLTEDVPVKPPLTLLVSAQVDRKFGLFRVLWLSEPFERDPRGTAGKTAYYELKAVLTEKYGTPTAKEFSGRSLWDEPDEFYQCLAYGTECGYWTALWRREGGAVSLKLEGIRRAEGRITITYEGPHFGAVRAEIQAADKARQQRAF